MNKSITLTGNSINTNSINGQGTLNIASGVTLDNSGSIEESIILNVASGSVLLNKSDITISSADTISGQINLNSGTLNLRDNVSIADLNLSAGAGNALIDMNDSAISTFNIAKVQGQGSDLKIDVDLNTGMSDKLVIAAAPANTELRLIGINVLQDGYADLITYIAGATNGINSTIHDSNPLNPNPDTSIVMTSGGYTYTFELTGKGLLSVSSRFNGTLAEAIANARVMNYSLVNDLNVTTPLGTLATQAGGRTFNLFGNNHTLSSTSTGIVVANADDIFNSENIKIDGFTNSFVTLNNGTVTVRERDTMEQVRISIDELDAYVGKNLEF